MAVIRTGRRIIGFVPLFVMRHSSGVGAECVMNAMPVCDGLSLDRGRQNHDRRLQCRNSRRARAWMLTVGAGLPRGLVKLAVEKGADAAELARRAGDRARRSG